VTGKTIGLKNIKYNTDRLKYLFTAWEYKNYKGGFFIQEPPFVKGNMESQ
jgi:hypothetical protein